MAQTEQEKACLVEIERLKAEVDRLRRLAEPWEFKGMVVPWGGRDA